jgi:hypothetical protein
LEEKVWALVAARAVEYAKAAVVVAKDAAHQVITMMQDQSVDLAMVGSMAGPFLGPYRATADLITLADDTAMVHGGHGCP